MKKSSQKLTNNHLLHKNKLKDAKEHLMLLLLTLNVLRGLCLGVLQQLQIQSLEAILTTGYRQLHFCSGNGASTRYNDLIPSFFFFSLNLPFCCPYTFLSLPTFLLNKQPIPNDVFFIGPTSLPKLVFLTALPKQSGPCMVLLCSHLDVNSLGCQDCLLTIWFMLLTFCLLQILPRENYLTWSLLFYLTLIKHKQFFMCSCQYQSNRIIQVVLTWYLHL